MNYKNFKNYLSKINVKHNSNFENELKSNLLSKMMESADPKSERKKYFNFDFFLMRNIKLPFLVVVIFSILVYFFGAFSTPIFSKVVKNLVKQSDTEGLCEISYKSADGKVISEQIDCNFCGENCSLDDLQQFLDEANLSKLCPDELTNEYLESLELIEMIEGNKLYYRDYDNTLFLLTKGDDRYMFRVRIDNPSSDDILESYKEMNDRIENEDYSQSNCSQDNNN